MFFCKNCKLFPLKKGGGGAFIWINLNPFRTYMFCANFGYTWPLGSGEEDLKMSSMYFHFIAIISLRERAWLYLQETWIPLSKEALGKVWLKWTQWFWRNEFLNVVNRACPFIWRTYIPFAHGCFVPSLVEFVQKKIWRRSFSILPM